LSSSSRKSCRLPGALHTSRGRHLEEALKEGLEVKGQESPQHDRGNGKKEQQAEDSSRQPIAGGLSMAPKDDVQATVFWELLFKQVNLGLKLRKNSKSKVSI
jgi:hypothetical protein